MRSHFVRLFSFLIFLLALSSCGKESKKSPESIYDGNHRWASFPVQIRVDELLLDHAQAESDLNEAIKFWEKRAGRDLFSTASWASGVEPFIGSPANPTQLLDNVIYFQKPWPHEPRVAGKTTLFSENGLIQKAAIFLNFQTDTCHGLCIGEPHRTSRRKLLAHELGHFLGLSHATDRNNIMYPEILPGGFLDNLKVDADALKRLLP